MLLKEEYDGSDSDAFVQATENSYVTRLVSLKMKDTNPNEYENLLSNETNSFLRQDYQTIGKKLFSFSFNIDTLSDDDFLILAKRTALSLSFIDNEEFSEIISSINNDARTGRFFVVLSGVLFQKNYTRFNKNANWRDSGATTISAYQEWLDSSEDERRRLLAGLLSLTIKHSDTPLELLAELV